MFLFFYYTHVYVYLYVVFADVIGAVLWWNLYFLQLIPKIRHWKQKSFHRVLGRFLLVVLLVQTISGVGLAATSHSNIIKLVSYVLAIATIFCICQAWRYAYFRDIPKHKHWVIRLVGYMQTISLQRFWLLVLIISHAFGWEGLYPQLDDDDATEEEWKELTKKMFDDSFVICILHAILSTEWYLATEQGMLDTPTNNRRTPIQKPEEGSDDDKNLNSSAESLESRGMNDDELVEEEEEHGNVQPSTMDDENSMKET